MAIHRAPRPEHHFTQIRNDVLRDERLSYRARGILAYILSNTDGWACDSVSLARKESGEGRDGIRSALAELKAAGYLVQARRQDGRGRWSTQSVVYDTPQVDDQPALFPQVTPETGCPAPVEPTPVQPTPVNPALKEEHHLRTDLPTGGVADPPSAALVIAERPDVERICNHLADRIAADGSKRPSITRGWRDAARLMLDKDGRTEQEVHRAIDWCQDHHFWRTNILSMAKLREQYDRLRKVAEAEQRPRPSSRQHETNDLFARAAERMGLTGGGGL